MSAKKLTFCRNAKFIFPNQRAGSHRIDYAIFHPKWNRFGNCLGSNVFRQSILQSIFYGAYSSAMVSKLTSLAIYHYIFPYRAVYHAPYVDVCFVLYVRRFSQFVQHILLAKENAVSKE